MALDPEMLILAHADQLCFHPLSALTGDRPHSQPACDPPAAQLDTIMHASPPDTSMDASQPGTSMGDTYMNTSLLDASVDASGVVTSITLSSDSRRLLVNLGAAEIHLWQLDETGGGRRFLQRCAAPSPSSSPHTAPSGRTCSTHMPH